MQFLNGGTAIPGAVKYTMANASASSFAFLTATLNTSFRDTSAITAQYLGDQNYAASPISAPVTVTITSGTPDFSLVPNPSSIMVMAPGDSANSTISISAINGFTSAVSFSCAVSSTMAGGSCSLVPTSASPGSNTVLTVNTTAPSTVIGPLNNPRWLIPIRGAILAAFFLLVIPTKVRRLRLALGSMFLALLAEFIAACGGGDITTTNPGTPTGSYTLTVTATSGSLSHSLNVPVSVQ